MKLKNKLFLYFGILFFISINIFGVVLIQYNFNAILKNNVNSALGEYAVIYTNIKSSENVKNIFFTDTDVIKIKTESYLETINNPNISLHFSNLNKEEIYSTNGEFSVYPEEIYTIEDNMTKYMVYRKNEDNELIINNKIIIKNNEYYFTYVNNLDDLYMDREKSYIKLIKMNIVAGVLLLIVIYLISSEITKPINSLIYSMDDIIKGKFSGKFKYKSNINEINAISKNFSLMNDEIQNKIELLKKQNDGKQRFINNLTHEIRTPLTSIIGYSDLMIKKQVKDLNIIYKSFENINREGNRILSLTSNLVALATLDKKLLNIENISLRKVVEDVKDGFEIKLNKFNVEFAIEGDDVRVSSDRELLTILISNFIDNAIKAVIEKEIKHITVILEKDSLKIQDTGKGIEKDELIKIFEPFYMIDRSRSKSLEGFGLGLSICNQIINMLNIQFNINSEINEGTEIILTFKEN